MNLFNLIIEKIGIEQFIINFIITLGIVLIYLRVFENFKQAKSQKNSKQKEVKSVVETASMSGFFMLCYLIVAFRIGTYHFMNVYIEILALGVYILRNFG